MFLLLSTSSPERGCVELFEHSHSHVPVFVFHTSCNDEFPKTAQILSMHILRDQHSFIWHCRMTAHVNAEADRFVLQYVKPSQDVCMQHLHILIEPACARQTWLSKHRGTQSVCMGTCLKIGQRYYADVTNHPGRSCCAILHVCCSKYSEPSIFSATSLTTMTAMDNLNHMLKQ